MQRGGALLTSGAEGQRVAIAICVSAAFALDRLAVMDAGRIREQGSHAELLAAGGLCARPWAHQDSGLLGMQAEGCRL